MTNREKLQSVYGTGPTPAFTGIPQVTLLQSDTTSHKPHTSGHTMHSRDPKPFVTRNAKRGGWVGSKTALYDHALKDVRYILIIRFFKAAT